MQKDKHKVELKNVKQAKKEQSKRYRTTEGEKTNNDKSADRQK